MPALTTNRPEGPSLIVQQNDHMIVAGGNNNTLQVDIMRQPIMDGGNWEVLSDINYSPNSTYFFNSDLNSQF